MGPAYLADIYDILWSKLVWLIQSITHLSKRFGIYLNTIIYDYL